MTFFSMKIKTRIFNAPPWLSKRKCPIGLKFYQITNFDMGFQKNNIRGRNKKVDFFFRVSFSDSRTITNYRVKKKITKSFLTPKSHLNSLEHHCRINKFMDLISKKKTLLKNYFIT